MRHIGYYSTPTTSSERTRRPCDNTVTVTGDRADGRSPSRTRNLSAQPQPQSVSETLHCQYAPSHIHQSAAAGILPPPSPLPVARNLEPTDGGTFRGIILKLPPGLEKKFSIQWMPQVHGQPSMCSNVTENVVLQFEICEVVLRKETKEMKPDHSWCYGNIIYYSTKAVAQ